MARKSLRSHLNQIRTWVRQGRTDAWIAHQLEIPAAQLRDFKRQHDLEAGGEEPEIDLRDEIEAEIEAQIEAAAAADAAEAEEGGVDEVPEDGATDEGAGGGDRGGRPRRRRRRRRGGRRGRSLEATFDHGETDGYGLWLDPAVKDDPVYAEHWAGRRRLRVLIEPGRIVLEPVDEGPAGAAQRGGAAKAEQEVDRPVEPASRDEDSAGSDVESPDDGGEIGEQADDRPPEAESPDEHSGGSDIAA